jgi:hypothetical protein
MSAIAVCGMAIVDSHRSHKVGISTSTLYDFRIGHCQHPLHQLHPLHPLHPLQLGWRLSNHRTRIASLFLPYFRQPKAVVFLFRVQHPPPTLTASRKIKTRAVGLVWCGEMWGGVVSNTQVKDWASSGVMGMYRLVVTPTDAPSNVFCPLLPS